MNDIRSVNREGVWGEAHIDKWINTVITAENNGKNTVRHRAKYFVLFLFLTFCLWGRCVQAHAFSEFMRALAEAKIAELHCNAKVIPNGFELLARRILSTEDAKKQIALQLSGYEKSVTHDLHARGERAWCEDMFRKYGQGDLHILEKLGPGERLTAPEQGK